MADEITDEMLMRSLLRLMVTRWKYILALLVVFAALFFGGGWLVYTDAKLKTSSMMMSLYKDVMAAQDKAKELLKETEGASDEAKKQIDLITKSLQEAQEVLDENIGILNRTIEKTVTQQHEVQIQQQKQIDEKSLKPVRDPREKNSVVRPRVRPETLRIEPPQLKQIR